MSLQKYSAMFETADNKWDNDKFNKRLKSLQVNLGDKLRRIESNS